MTEFARRLLRLATLALPMLALQAFAAPAPPRPVDQFIVRYKAGISASTTASASTRHALLDSVGRANGLRLEEGRALAIGARVVHAERALDAEAAQRLLRQLQADPRVEFAQVDGWMAPAFMPNDTWTYYQWNLFGSWGIRASDAWDVSAGRGVVVGVVDTGVVMHADLAANIAGGYDFITSLDTAGDGDGRDASYLDPGDFTVAGQCGTGSAATASTWHGTKVAGTIAAVTNNAAGIAGVAFRSQAMALRALGRCGGRVSDIADAIVWGSGGAVAGVPTNPNPVEVLNLSFSGAGACDPAMQAAINAAVGAGVVVVAAAGNRGTAISTDTPGSCANVVAVGASDYYGGRAPYSNYGSGLDLIAPGGYSSYPLRVLSSTGTQGPVQDTTADAEGTSLAAAQVSGVAALMQALKVNTPQVVEATLRGTARRFPNWFPKGTEAGIVDASMAVRAATGPVVFFEGGVFGYEGNSGTQTLTFTLRLSRPLTTPVTFDVATVDGTATAGSDYAAIALAGEAFAPGETSRTYSVTYYGDTVFEQDETLSLAVTNAVGAVIATPTVGATIYNDDDYFLTNGVPVPGLSGGAGSDRWFVIDVPTNATDLYITSTDDHQVTLSAYTGGKGGTLRCQTPTNHFQNSCEVINPPQARYYIRMHGDMEYSGVTLKATYYLVTASITGMTAVEGDSGTKLVSGSVSLEQPVVAPVTVDVRFTSGTATLGDDVIADDIIGMRFEPGERVKTFQVAVVGDTVAEPNEVLHMALSNPQGARLWNAEADAVILNNDGPTLSVGGVALAEGNAGTKVATFTVSLSQAAAVPVTYSIATQSIYPTWTDDFVSSSLSGETIPAGMLARTFSVTINGDTTSEANETFAVVLSQATGATILKPRAIGTILNDDWVTFSVLDASTSEGNSGSKTMDVTVVMSQALSVPVTFTIATANGTASRGVDYSAVNLTGQFPPGQTSKVFPIPITGDTTVEPNETFTVTLSNPSYGTVYDGQATATIYNDDGPTLSVNDVSIGEGNTGTKVATFTVSLSQAAAVPITYDIATGSVTATPGDDYVGKALVGETIPAGQLSKTFTVTLNGDTAVEPNETFRVTLSNIGAGATLFKYTGTGTITNDD